MVSDSKRLNSVLKSSHPPRQPRLFRDDLTLRCQVKYKYRILNTRTRVDFVLSFTFTFYVFYR